MRNNSLLIYFKLLFNGDKSMSESMNIAAKKIADKMVQDAEKLKVIPSTLSNGTSIIDCGVNAKEVLKVGNYLQKYVLVEFVMLEFQYLVT